MRYAEEEINRAEAQIQKLLKLKKGNKEMALFFYPPHGTVEPGMWELHIGNASKEHRLGEVQGQFIARAETIDLTLYRMFDLLRKYKGDPTCSLPY